MPPSDKWAQYEVGAPAPAAKPAAKPDKWAQYEATPAAPTAPTPAASAAPTGVLRAPTERERFLQPELYPVGLKGEGVGENIHNLFQRGGVGIFQLADAATHPRQTLASILASISPEPAVHAANRVVDWENRIPGMHYFTTHLPERTTNPLQQAYSALLTSQNPVEAAGKAAPLAGQALATAGLGEVLPPVAADIRAGVRSGAESLARSVTDTGTGPVKSLVEKTQLENKGIDLANQDRIAAHTRARTAADEANAAALRQYNQRVGQTIQQRRAAAAADQARRTAQADTQVYGSQLIYGLRQLDRSLRDRAATMFDGVRARVAQSGQPPLPGTELGSAARTALAKVTGSSELPKPFRDILGKYPDDAAPDFVYQGGVKFGPGTPLYESVKAAGNLPAAAPPVTFADLQGYYSETGSELAKGTLPGDIYQATRDLHNSVGDMMQRMADKAGAGKQFWDSRVFYRNYMNTFHEPTGPSGSGSPVAQVLLAKDPAVAVARFSGPAGARGVALLRQYHQGLADLAQRAGRIKQEVAAQTSQAAAPRTPRSITSIPPARTTTPPALELRPRATISSPDLAAARRAAAEARVNRIASRGQWAATWPLFQAARALWGGHIPSIPTMGLESAGMLATVRATTHLLRYPPLRQFLEQARPEDVPLIPPELRGDLPGLVSQAQRQGIKVSPALTAAVAAGTTAAGQAGQAGRQSVQAAPIAQPTPAPAGAVQ
jgi:hypothetical protein